MSVYDIAAYGAMMGDARRRSAYRAALQEAVFDGCTVLDIGTGTGIHAFTACRLGAGHVYAVECSDAIQVAREIARANGLEQRITFLHRSSEQVTLEQPVDVVVSDLRGILPLFGRHLPSIIDARERLLRRGGTLIPRRDEVHVAPVEAPATYEEVVGPWANGDGGIDMGAARDAVTQHIHRKRVAPDSLIAEPRRWAVLDYERIADSDVDGTLDFDVTRAARLHGYVAWFDATLTDGIGFSSAPGAAELVYGTAFLPLTEPVGVQEGDHVTLDLRARLIGDAYVWKWATRVRPDTPTSVRFDQSTFHGAPLTRRTLQLADADGTPQLSQQGRIDATILNLIDGRTPLRDIARRVAAAHPRAFDGEDDALDRVAALARRYAE